MFVLHEVPQLSSKRRRRDRDRVRDPVGPTEDERLIPIGRTLVAAIRTAHPACRYELIMKALTAIVALEALGKIDPLR